MTRQLSRTITVAACTAVLLASAFDASAAKKSPLKVFLLVGQSNMQGHAQVRTFDVIGMDPKTAPMLKEMRNADGTYPVCDQVWISSIGSSAEERVGKLTVGFGAEKGGPKIGPEFTFGIYMQKLLGEPVLIIKTAWGGKSLHTDFRPPSAGPYELPESQVQDLKKQGKDVDDIKAKRAEASGHYYRLMMEHVNKVLGDIKRVYPDYDAKAGYELSGFVWFQGWNDMVDGGVYPDRYKPGGYDDYSRLLAMFIRDVRKDLSAPELPFIIGVMGAGGPTRFYEGGQKRYQGVHQYFRDAMAAPAALPEFKNTVKAVLTENYWDMELTALRKREQALKAKLKELGDGGMSKDDLNKKREALYADAFTADELNHLKNGASNAEFHYLGSGKILGQIGKAFAEALAPMVKGQ